ncbi:TetR family transcriptional regulator [Bacillus sp. FJAT-27916]|uniref:TetR/AcrR family transcriptional regulator n=1 Tax=Bacillus sp. FJAT-27916 TaxID=1679169 RepID=UPI000670EFED|nr:TetR/AcrR family transcriptional regulator [Bacillus sp. FJAT-27916]KMY45955.1 TetR family transcriptional regulator [Bacillus sp. FJAT-27916]
MNKRKRHVADVALKLFVEKGIQQTSIQEIIELANISKGTFYNYFSSKNDCIAEILEGLRYDASQLRMEMQMGRDPNDRQIFIEQISILMKLNEERNLHAVFEAIMSSNEPEHKKLVLHHRFHEMEWLSHRFVDLYGEDIREYALECAVLFFGMMQYVMFTVRISHMPHSVERIVDVLLSYIELIYPSMIDGDKSLINQSSLHFLRSNIDRRDMTLKSILETAAYLEKQDGFTEEQQDLFSAIVSELKQERIRKCVIQPLLKPLQLAFSQTPLEMQVANFTNMVWYFLKGI